MSVCKHCEKPIDYESFTKGEAESCVRQWPGSTLVRRTVGHGPWEVA